MKLSSLNFEFKTRELRTLCEKYNDELLHKPDPERPRSKIIDEFVEKLKEIGGYN